jgi:large conductance mechanosensitive channel
LLCRDFGTGLGRPVGASTLRLVSFGPIHSREASMKGFRQFLLRGNVVDMAVGIVVGAAFGGVVAALVKDLLTPLVAAIVGRPDFSALVFTVHGSRFLYGEFVNSILSFLIIAAVIYYFVILPMNAVVARSRSAPPADPTTRKCPECLSEIPIEARRCAFCTSALA